MLTAWGIIPARGGSKSIPRKNIVPLCGRPLVDYTVQAAKHSVLTKIIGSTDDKAIGEVFSKHGVDIDWRPPELATDDSPVIDTVRRILQKNSDNRDSPDIVVLLQPTSPFVLPQHINKIVEALSNDEKAVSAQTIYQCPHAFHAWNQRNYKDDYVSFEFLQERLGGYNKQRKPKFWVFGNLFAVRVDLILDGGDFFSEPSRGIEIDPSYGFDLDVERDLAVAEAMIRSKIVNLPHMDLKVTRGTK